MLKTILPTFSWLVANTILYGAYDFFDLDAKISQFSQQTTNLKQLQFLQQKPLFWLYLFSTAVILLVGIFDIHRRRKERKEEYAQKKSKQRRNYRAH